MKITDLKRYIVLSAAPLFEIGEEIPEEFPVFEYGKTEFIKDGKPDFYTFSESDADNIIALFARKGNDGIIDYEHQLLRSMFNGLPVPAAAWIKRVYKMPDGLWCSASWTPKARGFLENGEYKYISPVFKASRTGKNITELFNISLTARPSTNNQRSLIAADDFTEGFDGLETNKQPKRGSKMNEILLLLGLTALADSDDQAAINSGMKTAIQGLLDGKKATDDFLALHDADCLDVVTAKIGQMVPATEKIDLENKIKQRDADDAVMQYLSDGKLTDAQKDSAKVFALNDLEAFKKFYDAAPVIVPNNNGVTNLENPNGGDGDDSEVKALSDSEIEILGNLGLEGDALKAAAKDLKKGA